VVALALANRVRFDFGAGFTVPTQIVLVPMLFALPPGAVAPLTAVAFALGSVPDVLRGRMPAARIPVALGNSWFALGPAAVFAAIPVAGPGSGFLLLVPALLAQALTDLCGSAIRERIRGELSLHELVLEMRPVLLIDVALTPLGLAMALAAVGRPWAALLMLPLFGLLAVFSTERRSGAAARARTTRTTIASTTAARPSTVAAVRFPPAPISRSPTKMASIPTPQTADQRGLPDGRGAVDDDSIEDPASSAIAAPPAPGSRQTAQRR